MAISLSQVANDLSSETIRPYWISYFREFARAQLHDQLLEMFEAWKAKGNNRAGLAKKLDRRPEQITRWLSAPSNLEFDSVSDMALAMGCVPKVTFESVETLFRNHNGPVQIEIESDPTGLITERRPVTGSSSGILRGAPVPA